MTIAVAVRVAAWAIWLILAGAAVVIARRLLAQNRANDPGERDTALIVAAVIVTGLALAGAAAAVAQFTATP